VCLHENSLNKAIRYNFQGESVAMIITQYIKNRFGSKRGFLNAFLCALKLRLGGYRLYQSVPLDKISRLIFICSGNICRSPLAEYVAKNCGAPAISFGLHCRGGDPADSRAITFAKTLNIDLTPHLTQNISTYIPQAGDLLVGMEPRHAQELEHLFGARVPITLAGLWLEKKQAYIHDPYNANSEFFDWCEHQVALAIESLTKSITR
jgi:protein-tyrosine phosphatase